EECSIVSDSTWSMDSQAKANRIFLVLGTYHGQPAWWYTLLYDDPEKIRDFKRMLQGENAGRYTLNLHDYGVILQSGFGIEPPQDINDSIWDKLK
ncbi:MAG: hypothetical protein ETSY2_55195, partial [Candidatus Entotheonella gemina]